MCALLLVHEGKELELLPRPPAGEEVHDALEEAMHKRGEHMQKATCEPAACACAELCACAQWMCHTHLEPAELDIWIL